MALTVLTASAGRFLDELIGSERVSTSYISLPFGVVAIGFAVRGFAGFLPGQQDELANLELLGRLAFTPVQWLAMFIVAGVVMSVMSVRVSANVSDETLEDVVDTPREDGS